MSHRSLAPLALLLSIGCGAGPATDDGPDDTDDVDPLAPDAAPLESCTVASAPSITHGAPTPTGLEVHVLAAYSDAVCNDGTPATYVLRRNDTSRWLIFLDGGGFCADDASCAARYGNANGGHKLMSSTWLIDEAAAGTLTFPSDGIFSPDPVENPTFFDANIVRVPYCSSDTWVGDRAGDPAAPVTSAARWAFRGRRIVEAVVTDLLATQGLDAATDVVLAGGSAGGQGVFGHADDLGARLPAGARYMAMPNAGFFIDHAAYDPATQTDSTATPTVMTQIADLVVPLWQARGDTSCLAAAGDAPTLNERQACVASPSLAAAHITTPLLIVQSLFDQNQTERLGVPLDPDTGRVAPGPDEAARRAFVTRFADDMAANLRTAAPRHSVFADWSNLHVILAGRGPGDVQDQTVRAEVDGQPLNAVIEAWHADPCGAPVRLIDLPSGDAP